MDVFSTSLAGWMQDLMSDLERCGQDALRDRIALLVETLKLHNASDAMARSQAPDVSRQRVLATGGHLRRRLALKSFSASAPREVLHSSLPSI